MSLLLARQNVVYTENLSETVPLSESVTTKLHAVVSKAETVLLTESVTAHAKDTVVESETVLLTESVTAQAKDTVAESETVSLSESVATRAKDTAAESETVPLSESVATRAKDTVAESETFSLTESVTAHAKDTVVESETVPFTESATAHARDTAAESETVLFTESVTARAKDTVVESETVGLSDGAAVHVREQASISETVVLTESAAESQLRRAIVSETVEITESVSVLGGEIVQPPSFAQVISVSFSALGIVVQTIDASGFTAQSQMVSEQINASINAQSVTSGAFPVLKIQSSIAGAPVALFVNTRIRVLATFKDLSGNLFDPQVISFKYTLPGYAIIDGSSNVVRDGVGAYHIDLLVTQPGKVLYNWSSTFTQQEAYTEGSFTVSARTT